MKNMYSEVDNELLSSNSIEELPKIKLKSKEKSDNDLNKILDNENLRLSKPKVDLSQIDCATASSDIVNESLKKKAKIKCNSDLNEISNSEMLDASKEKLKCPQVRYGGVSNCNIEETLKTERVITTFNENEKPVFNKYSEALTTNSNASLTSSFFPKFASKSQELREEIIEYPQTKSFFEECFDPNDLYKSNIFLVQRIYSQFNDYYSILNGCLRFSKLQINKFFDYRNTCILTTRVNGQVLKLGEAVNTTQRKAQEAAVKNAVENLLKKCYTIVIKKRSDTDKVISISELKGNQEKCEDRADGDENTLIYELKPNQKKNEDRANIDEEISNSEVRADFDEEISISEVRADIDEEISISEVRADIDEDISISEVRADIDEGISISEVRADIDEDISISEVRAEIDEETSTSEVRADIDEEISISEVKVIQEAKNEGRPDSNEKISFNEVEINQQNNNKERPNGHEKVSINDVKIIQQKKNEERPFIDGKISLSQVKQNQQKKNVETISVSKINQQKENEQNYEENNALNDSNNLGAKMLKRMGWSGGGLGKNEDGIKEPVSLISQIGRAGFGLKKKDVPATIFKAKVNSTSIPPVPPKTNLKVKVKDAPKSIFKAKVEDASEIIVEAKDKSTLIGGTNLGLKNKNTSRTICKGKVKNIPKRRADLGVKNEDSLTPIFKAKVNSILTEMRTKHLASFDVVKDAVFTPELSNVERKYIHRLVTEKYKELSTKSYGNGLNRYIAVKPKLDAQRLVYSVLLQGGTTESYLVHKPGTMTCFQIFNC